MEDNYIYPLIVAAITVEAICVSILFYKNRIGRNIKIWYDEYKIGAYFFDVLALIFCSSLSILLSSNFFMQIIIVIVIGLIHDLTFGYFINRSKPKTGISKLFYDYAKEGTWKILVIDAMLLTGTIITFNYLKTIDVQYLGFIGSVLAYIGLYIVYSFKKLK